MIVSGYGPPLISGRQFARQPWDRPALARGRVSRSHQQHFFDGRQSVVCRQNRARCRRGLDVRSRHTGARLGSDCRSIDRLHRDRHRFSPMGGLFLGDGLLRSAREMDRQAGTRFARHCCGAVGNPDLGIRMAHSGALVPFLAADLHLAAALLDRLSSPSILSVHVPIIRLASSFAFTT